VTNVGGSVAFEDLLQFFYMTPVGIVKFGADGAIDLINPMASQLLLPLLSDTDLANLYDALAPLIPDLRQIVGTFSSNAGIVLDRPRLETHAGGKLAVLSVTVNRVNDTAYIAVLVDVTKLAIQERRLMADQQRFRAIFAHVRDYAIYTVTLDGIIDEWNQSLQRFGGWEAADVQGKHIGRFFPGGDSGSAEPTALLAEAQRIGSVETESWRLKRDGSRLWGNTVITAMPDETGAVRGFVVVTRDMTERKRMEDELEKLSVTDPLTGTFNRRYGYERLTAEFGRRARTGESFAILMLDIDHFKLLNDRFGHEAGDAVLCAVVQVCRTTVRSVDMVARWGGEEFVILLPETDAAAAVAMAERLCAMIGALRIPLGSGENLACTVSIGVAGVQNDDPNGLLRRADEALYAAKSGGRNRVVLRT
jgi:diguanylate cyclase (GGDEF)-like protein/PAS domain S-box-containing protein